jgi:hypothetical protein
VSPQLYVYGVVATGSLDAPELEGVRAQAVVQIEDDGLAALASELPEPDVRVRRRDLQAHLDVMEAAFERTTIIPCSFGTAFPSEEAVREELLGARREHLLELLEVLDRRAQFELSVVYDDETVLREVVRSEPEIAKLSSQTREGGDATYFARMRLGELVAEALEARRRADAGSLLDALAPHAEAVEVQDARQDRVLKASFLVPQDRIRVFEHAVEQLAEDGNGRMRFQLVGPLPPTAFVRPADAEVGAWA